MEIKRKRRPTKFQREFYDGNIEIWMKLKEQIEDLMENETSEDVKEYVTDANSTITEQIEDYYDIKSTNRTRRSEFPIKRLRKRKYKMNDRIVLILISLQVYLIYSNVKILKTK